MGAQQTNARNAGTSSEDEDTTVEATNDYAFFWLGSLLLLQRIYDQYVSHLEMNRETDELLPLLGWRGIEGMFPYLPLNSRDLPPPFEKYLGERPRSWKSFLETNLRVNEIDLSRLKRLFVREHVGRELSADSKYLEEAVTMGRDVGYLSKADHDAGQRHVKCAVAAAWFQGECKDDGLACHLLPRFYLLQALCDKLPILILTYETFEQYRMSREISGFFALILDAASASKEMYVSEVVDRFLVPYLKSQSELAKSLRDYLPKRYQSWKDFLDRMEFNDEEKVFFALHCDPSPEDSLQLLKACESLIEDFKSKYLNTVVWRIRDFDPRVFSVPEIHTEVDVFYATDRHVTEDGEYIGQHSAISDWRKGKELHFGITKVGIPDEKGATIINPPLKHVEILSIDTTLQHENRGFVKKINDELVAQACTSIH